MGEREPEPPESLRHRVRNMLGAKIGMRPTWFDQEVWDAQPGQRHMIIKMHDQGGKGFNIVRSAETTFKRYRRVDTLSDRDQ